MGKEHPVNAGAVRTSKRGAQNRGSAETWDLSQLWLVPGSFNSQLPSVLNVPALSHGRSKSLRSRAWKPHSQVAYSKGIILFFLQGSSITGSFPDPYPPHMAWASIRIYVTYQDLIPRTVTRAKVSLWCFWTRRRAGRSTGGVWERFFTNKQTQERKSSPRFAELWYLKPQSHFASFQETGARTKLRMTQWKRDKTQGPFLPASKLNNIVNFQICDIIIMVLLFKQFWVTDSQKHFIW